jgi:hypothetical protein
MSTTERIGHIAVGITTFAAAAAFTVLAVLGWLPGGCQ